MSTKPDSIHSRLKRVVCEGMAYDVFHAANTRRLLETLNHYRGSINKSDLVKSFFANLQSTLQAHLCLSLTRLYADCSSRNKNRSIATAVHLIEVHAGELRIANREPLIQFLVSQGEARDALASQKDKELSLRLVQHLKPLIPKADSQSGRPLDQALENLKTMRDKAVAHRDDVAPASFPFPVWSEVVELIKFAQKVTVLINEIYALDTGIDKSDLEYSAIGNEQALRFLLNKAGITPGSVQEQDTA